ncbi:MAG: hypothetical protein CL840_07045 [Crocinitomicaceae bacterium]|nr:hypothetical protein [Crocinitomicaceae bacterium]|tara:strand:+ start:2536 stop:3141 length:606 start_codon:yes stop_codon:yes gene_type:complete
MNTKLQELADKIYREGIEKAQQESETILANAKAEAKKIISEAEKKRESILINAEEEANSFKKNITSEVQLSARQLAEKLRQDIREMLHGKIIESPISNTFSDPETLKKLISKSIESVKITEDGNVRIALSDKDNEKIGESIKNDIRKQFNSGVLITQDKTIKQGFKIGPENGNYLISFTDEDFNNLFGQFLRKETHEIIHG